jgi:hypothetical protein
MANTQTDSSKNVNQQGNGSNNATADPQKERDQKNNPQYRDSESEDQSKVTNQDSKITNRDEPMRKDPKAQEETNDDEDVDEKGRVEDYKDDHEIDMPTRDPEKTEKKIPNMER